MLATTIFSSAAFIATPALAQDQPEEPVVGENPQEATDESGEEEGGIVVTGSRIARPNLTANSPIAVVTGDAVVEQGDVTLETYLNTLPQANPAGTTTSNNPGNAGQATIDLRGLGSNRNLVLINGRRPMVSASTQTVDLNTIPQGLIERIEVVTGGAGAAYGADAIAGVVNIILRDDFEGIDLRATYSQSLPEMDAREYQISGLIGGNFADGRGNMALAVEYADREGLIKAQRGFAAQATSTTGTFPTGRYTPSACVRGPVGTPTCAGNPIPQAAINTLFAGYGSAAVNFPTEGLVGFNSDQSVFGIGTFNDPRNVANYRYDPLGLDPAAANQNFFPDFYSYNFDIVNILVLPLERKSAFLRGNFEINPSFDIFVQAGYTDYTTFSALAPTPLGTTIRAPGQNTQLQASTPLLNTTGCRNNAGQPFCQVTGLVVPTTNPFIPADLRTLLNARTGDSNLFVGSGANEAFGIAYRFLGTGLREQEFENRVMQGLVGLRGDITDGWRYETYVSWGNTVIDQEARGNVNVQQAQALLEAPDGGAALCDGGFNPFGIQPLSPDCVEFVNETGRTQTEFTQRIIQGYVTGELTQLPAGPLSLVLGAEHRHFDFRFDPGALFGPIAGFNTATPSRGTNVFRDFFGELLIPIARDRPWIHELEVNLTARHSTSDFDEFNGIPPDVDGEPQGSWAYGATLSYAPVPELRLRASYQHSVRAPNFGELFAGGGGFPQIFDPCSVTSEFRTSGGAAARNLCLATGLSPTLVDTFVQTPGGQAFLTVTGNTALEPEEGDTFTLGAVFQALGFTGSVDYYNINLGNTILFPDVNEIIASCYGYNDINPDLDPASPFCTGLFRQSGNIAAIFLPPELGGDPVTGYFQAVNQGSIKTSGIDAQLAYRLPTDFVQAESSLSLNLLVNYLIDFTVEGLGGLETDYAGTVSYFGAGLGTSFPRWKGNLSAAWNFDPLSLHARVRYIHAMESRAQRQFETESSFTGPGAIWYFDFAVQAEIENMTFRVGLNNAFDQQPPTFAPNVQSGTDPSLYDVIGRRAYVQARLRF